MEHVLLVVVGVMSVRINANPRTAAEKIETRAGPRRPVYECADLDRVAQNRRFRAESVRATNSKFGVRNPSLSILAHEPFGGDFGVFGVDPDT